MSEAIVPVEYRNIEGFPGYCVGNDGSVWSCWKQIMLGWRYGSEWLMSDEWRQLKPSPKKRGHLCIGLAVGKQFMVHRLVLAAFVGRCPKGMQGCHYDGNPANNHISNLRWDTPKANAADTMRHGRHPHGAKQWNARLTDETIRAIRAEHAALKGSRCKLPHHALERMEEKYGITKNMLNQIVRRKAWKHVA